MALVKYLLRLVDSVAFVDRSRDQKPAARWQHISYNSLIHKNKGDRSTEFNVEQS